ncbi:MAG: sigma-70 family RNA polymerase sigma factor [Saprospiraceae bacterium]|nr:sigma-70 family RNA polymerase sigma factor [Saprospiraceae bacterium]
MKKSGADISERELVEGCRRNERFYQEHLYRRYFDRMMRMVMRYARDEDEGLLILNNGFLKVFQNLDSYSFQGSLEGWIRRLVFNCLSDYYRRKSNRLHFMELSDWDRPQSGKGLENLYLEDLLSLADRLPDATRRVFYLYAVEGYTHAEIGEQLQISDGTSKWHLSEARKKLKKMIRAQNNSSHYAG